MSRLKGQGRAISLKLEIITLDTYRYIPTTAYSLASYYATQYNAFLPCITCTFEQFSLGVAAEVSARADARSSGLGPSFSHR